MRQQLYKTQKITKSVLDRCHDRLEKAPMWFQDGSKVDSDGLKVASDISKIQDGSKVFCKITDCSIKC